MPSSIAAFVFAVVILGLFVLDREPKARTSKALWISVTWLSIVGSREVSRWLAAFGMGPAAGADEYVEGNPIDRMIYTGLLAIGLAVLIKRGPAVMRLLRANPVVVLFFLYCGASVSWSDYSDIAFKRWIKALTDLVMVLIVLTETDRTAAIRRLFSRTTFLVIPMSVLLIKYYPDLGRGFKNWVWTPVYYGVTTNKNLLGIICLLFGLASEWRLLAALRQWRLTGRFRQVIAHASVLVMVLWLFRMANSMTALAAFLLAGGLMAVTSWIHLTRTPVLALLLVAVTVAIPFSTLFLDTGGSPLEAMGKDSTLTGRTELWDLVIGLSGNPLLGTGFESFWLGRRLDRIWSLYWWHPNEAHNGYLEVYLNLGWIGLGLIAAMIVAAFRDIIPALPRDPELNTLRLAYATVAVVYNFTEAGFRVMNPIWITFLLTIMAGRSGLRQPVIRLISQPVAGRRPVATAGEPVPAAR